MLNTITIMGRLVRDPEMRRTNSGVSVTSFTIACDRDFGEKETDFIDCVAWRNTAEFVNNYFAKGRMAVVSGRLQIRKYEDKNGNKRTAAEIVAEHVYFGESKNDSGNQNSGYTGFAKTENVPGNFAPIEGDDFGLPF
jgi:single-strand DNA-binding protein